MTNRSQTVDETGLDQVDPSTHPARDATHFRRIVAARTGLVDAGLATRNVEDFEDCGIEVLDPFAS